MSLRNSKDTIITNIVQQGVSVAVFLVLPNLISVDDYAEIVFVNVLLSFMLLSDLGLTSVYHRKMPGVYHSGDTNMIEAWNVTAFWFRLLSSAAYGLLGGLIYLWKFAQLQNAILLIAVPPLITLSAFFISQYTVQSEFGKYRSLNSFRAYTKLLTIPFVYTLGLFGWFVSQVLAALLAVFKIKEKVFPVRFNIDFGMIRGHLLEGMSLVGLTFLWIQLLGSARLFAAFYYPVDLIAQYGLLNSGYQILSALIISAFLPITVFVLKKINYEEEYAINYTFKMIYITLPIVFIMVILGSFFAPPVLSYIFPKYTIDLFIVKSLILSLACYPLIVTLGNIFVGKKRVLPYLFLTGMSLLFCWLLVVVLDDHFGYNSAAIAQLVSINVYVFAELLLLFYLFRGSIKHKMKRFITIYGMISVFYGTYFFLERAIS